MHASYSFLLLSNTIHFSVSIMFDEASDIQMHGNLNVFVNVCLYTGEVRTLTLALKGDICMYVINKLFVFNKFLNLCIYEL